MAASLNGGWEAVGVAVLVKEPVPVGWPGPPVPVPVGTGGASVGASVGGSVGASVGSSVGSAVGSSGSSVAVGFSSPPVSIGGRSMGAPALEHCSSTESETAIQS